MPELPEVETTRRGILPHVRNCHVMEVIVRRRDLRQPVPASLSEIEGLRVVDVIRRAKYLIVYFEQDHHVIIHLGMSGSLRIVDPATAFRTHDHIALTLSNGKQLRFHDPRRFGIVTHAVTASHLTHTLFANLGPEPLEHDFHAAYLKKVLHSLQRPIKLAIMDNAIVVGVGNIYASESLFHAGIHPATASSKLSLPRLRRLVEAIREVLQKSIEQGGTTLRDFLRENGEPGYFRQELFVYERDGQACRVCATPISKIIQGQRSTYFCHKCQKR
ncbi:MAG: bifunctional DNA-formamidopyrimidine glycosylase/DNA-(apurinic or apyrimidinic site) lyase [Verrucomicrobiota bacterium]|jgi:formamidopyrimidine-DNA glycosylase